ncbi:Clathrin interactor EPSIN 1, partial [Glycine soja]
LPLRGVADNEAWRGLRSGNEFEVRTKSESEGGQCCEFRDAVSVTVREGAVRIRDAAGDGGWANVGHPVKTVFGHQSELAPLALCPSTKREVNLKVLKVPEIESKVLDATDNEPWGPHGTVLAEISKATKKFTECQMVMNVLWTRLGETGKDWRYVYKALAVIEYLVAHGSERAVDDIIEHTFQISVRTILLYLVNLFLQLTTVLTSRIREYFLIIYSGLVKALSSFEYVEPSGKDVGLNVRKKVENIVSLLNDKDKIHEVRNKAANCDKLLPRHLGKASQIESMLSIETSNPKNLELQDALLTWIREVPLLLIQLGDKHPTCFNIFPLEEAGTKGVKLCSLWQENVKNSAWHPFKVVTVDDKASYVQP